MKIIVIDWDRKLIEEYETDSVMYEEDGVSYTTWLSENHNHKILKKIPYNQFLGIKE